MNKISAEQTHSMLTQAAQALRTLVEERDELLRKVAALEETDAVNKLATEMHAKGLERHVPLDELVESLREKHASGKFAAFKDAVGLVGHDMGAKLASVKDEGYTSGSGNAVERLEHAILAM